MISDSGERLIINDKWDLKTITEHRHRYLAAASLVNGGTVLDAACGTGYGSLILAEKANRVFGIDVSAEATTYAKQHYSASNIVYRVMSVEKLEFPSSFFDIIVSFETIEHVSKETQLKFLKEIKRCLKPSGILIMSTPNDDLYRKMTHGTYFNPYHIAEFSETSFESFLKTEFTSVQIYYQNIADVSCLFRRGIVQDNMTGFRADTKNEIARYYLAFCTNDNSQIVPCDTVLVPNMEKFYNQIFFERKGMLYLDYGNGFSGENSMVSRSKVKNYTQFQYVFENINNIRLKELRFDPCETSARIKITSVESNVSELAIVALNANETVNGIDVFYHVDPIYILKSSSIDKIEYLNICGEIEDIPEQVAFYRLLEEKNFVSDQLKSTYEVLQSTRKVLDDTVMIRDKNLSKALEIEKKLNSTYNKLQNIQNKNSELLNQVKSNKEAILDMQQKLKNETHVLQMTREVLRGVIHDKNIIADRLEKSQQAYNVVINSRVWRLTSPIRKCLDKVKKSVKNNAYAYKIIKILKYLREYGPHATLKKIKWKLLLKHKIKLSLEENKEEAQFNIISMNKIERLVSFHKTIAIHIHLFYPDLAKEFCTYLKNMPFPYDLYISCNQSEDITCIKNMFNRLPNIKQIVVKNAQNRGRDLAPLYVLFAKDIVKYEYFLHIHTKKSLYTGSECKEWRVYAINSLLGSKEVIQKIFALFERQPDIGIFSPDTLEDLPIVANTWLSNGVEGQMFLSKLGIHSDEVFFNYPVGSFFWAKTDAIKPVFECNLKYEDFPEEKGQTDGTLAHALERAIAFVAKERKYRLAFHDLDSGNVTIGKSLNYLRRYFSLTPDDVINYLMQFDVITFDIFDTLITRRILTPDDLFKIINEKIKNHTDRKVDFYKLRKTAEQNVWKRLGAKCSLNDIYLELQDIMEISTEQKNELLKMEISLEKDVVIPRKDMRKIFNTLVHEGKKIILLSDMYLSKSTIEELLVKCGYVGYSEIWISCEIGARKDDGTMWNLFFEKYGKCRTVHVGDNPQSDIQMVMDRGRDSLLVMNPYAQYQCSNLYSKFKKYENDTSLSTTIILGMIVNEGLFNSPFCQNIFGNPVINSAEEIGFLWFGPIMTCFMEWLSKERNSNTGLLFLAREGYILQKLYKSYCKAAGIDELPNCYFLSSRRAVSVAGIRTEDDLRNVVNQYYVGSLSNFLRSRFSLALHDLSVDQHISMPQDEQKVMKLLKSYASELHMKIQEERNNYIEYINICKNKMHVSNLIVVDVGYSGTIQYYLAKLVNANIGGLYLSTGVNKKPLSIGCTCESIYPVDTIEETKTSKIFLSQLFLEAGLQAPYGQFVHFKKNDGTLTPEYLDDCEVPIAVQEIQRGMIRFSYTFGTLSAYRADTINKNLAEDIFYSIPIDGVLNEKICKDLSVQDDYCSNGRQIFDSKTRKWIVDS